MDIGQLFMIGFDGTTVPAETQSLFRWNKAGGAILFRRNIESLEQVVALNAALCELGSPEMPMLIGVDQEGGRVARLRDICTPIPSMRSLGTASQDENDLPYRIGALMARELSVLGFHLDFAPVVDVDTNPDNPVIGERSFGRDAHHVARSGAQFIRGMQQAGVAASAKHFPGHGDTDTDSHLALPRVPHNVERLESIELVPFKAAIDVGVATIMTAHVVIPELDATLPATLSKSILTGILREKLGYQGVIVSDDLEMAAVADHWPIEELVRLGLRAGVDLFLVCHDAEKQARAIESAHRCMEEGVVSKSQIEASLKRVQEMKHRFVGAPAPPSLDDAKQIVRCAPHMELVNRFTQADATSARAQSWVDEA